MVPRWFSTSVSEVCMHVTPQNSAPLHDPTAFSIRVSEVCMHAGSLSSAALHGPTAVQLKRVQSSHACELQGLLRA